MRDWTLPKYKYLGPGNRLDKGKPNNRNDAVAFKHDLAYDHHIKKGRDPYWQYSKADEEARNQFGHEDYGGTLGRTFFTAKKFAWQAGALGSIDMVREKRVRGAEDKGIEPANKRLATARRQPSFTNSSRDTPNNPPPPTSTAMSNGPTSDGQGSGNNLGLKETPVDEPYNVHRGPPDYTFASLPFIEEKRIGIDSTYAIDHVYRLTSPYDPSVTINGPTDFNPSTATVNVYTAPGGNDAVVSKARWFDFYAGMYNYYHVISVRYQVYIENFGGEPLYAHMMFYNNDLPNAGATNHDIMLWPRTKTRFLKSPYNAITAFGQIEQNEGTVSSDVNAKMDENDPATNASVNYETGNHVTSRGGHVSTQFFGEYRPGDFKREINLDSEVENWTLTTTNPALQERLLIRIKPENPGIGTTASVYGDDLDYKISVHLDYLVEFKELKSSLRYPVQEQPLVVNIQANPFEGI